MTIFAATFVVIGFAFLAHFIGLIRWTTEVIAHARGASAVLGDASLDDLAKENAIQRAALVMFKLLGLLIVGSVAALGLPIGAVWLADRVGVLSFDAVMAMLVRWEFLLAATIIGFGVFYILHKRAP